MFYLHQSSSILSVLHVHTYICFYNFGSNTTKLRQTTAKKKLLALNKIQYFHSYTVAVAEAKKIKVSLYFTKTIQFPRHCVLKERAGARERANVIQQKAFGDSSADFKLIFSLPLRLLLTFVMTWTNTRVSHNVVCGRIESCFSDYKMSKMWIPSCLCSLSFFLPDTFTIQNCLIFFFIFKKFKKKFP